MNINYYMCNFKSMFKSPSVHIYIHMLYIHFLNFMYREEAIGILRDKMGGSFWAVEKFMDIAFTRMGKKND